MAAITRKVGPLPLWAYAAILVVGYFLYQRLHTTGSGTSGASSTTSADGSGTYVPPFDAASGGIGGGIGAAGLGTTTNNYYYGDQGAGQATGGGTSSGTGDGTGGGSTTVPPNNPAPTGGLPVSVPGYPTGLGVTPPSNVSQFQVPVKTQLGVGGSRASGVAGLV